MRASTHPTAVFLVFLIGCAAPEPAPSPVGLVPDAGGLQPNGTPLRIDFGRAEAGVIAAVTRLKATPPERRRDGPRGCSELAWDDGLRLVFVEGRFVGWTQDGRVAGAVCGDMSPV